LIDVILSQQSDGFSVSVGFVCDALFAQEFPQFAEVLDDTIMHNGHLATAVGVGVVHVRRAMCRPTRVANARFSGKRFMHQQIA